MTANNSTAPLPCDAEPKRGPMTEETLQKLVEDVRKLWTPDSVLANAPYQPHGGNEATPPDQPTK